MSKKHKSARGEIVDFDLLKIKEQMASVPQTNDVRSRQNFIDKRFKRRVKKALAAAETNETPTPVVVLHEPTPTEELVPPNETTNVVDVNVDQKIKQKARPPKTIEE